jgi:UDP-N-acetylmuramoyl-tripeptide--D-alanyl-D-alanine ligase
MITLKASQIAQIINGALVGDDIDISAPSAINSAAVSKGGIFFALVGEKSDGHDFVADAFSHGALLAVTSKTVAQRHIQVSDVSQALATLARFVREELKDLKVIGITGSQGKTTTKDLLKHLLSGQGNTVAPAGNYNNELGVPLTLLQCDRSTKYAIIEMGARHSGDIAHLASIARPDLAVVLRVGMAHIGEFGSIETIAKTKSELVSSLSPSGVAILGQYDRFTPAMASLHAGKTITFGSGHDSDVRATEIEIREGRPHFDLVTPDGRAAVGLQLIGEHQISNALACAAVATALEIPLDSIASALSTAIIESKWRMEIHEFSDVLLINDSYNASPDAMEAALRTLTLFAQERGGRSWAFVGKMAELGESSAHAHSQVGTLALTLGIDHLVCVDAPEYAPAQDAKGETALHFCDQGGAEEVASQIEAGDVILVKASRSERFEILAEKIEQVVREHLGQSETEGDRQ